WSLRGARATIRSGGTRLLGFSPGPRTAFKVKASEVNGVLHVDVISRSKSVLGKVYDSVQCNIMAFTVMRFFLGRNL
ncbi:unnamed protein product, partial [Ectocarpus sp. 8 AP-2014]